MISLSLDSGVMGSLVAQMVENPRAIWETWVHSLDWKNKGMATHSSILAWRISMDRASILVSYKSESHKESDMTWGEVFNTC